MCLDTREIKSPVSVTKDGLIKFITRRATRDIVCYKKLDKYNGNLTSRNGNCDWPTNNVPVTVKRFTFSKFKNYHPLRDNYYRSTISIEAGLHAFLDKGQCSRSGYDGRTYKMIIPAGTKYILGTQGNDRQIVALVMKVATKK